MAVSQAQADLERLQREVASLRMRLADAESQITKVNHYIELSAKYEAGEQAVKLPPDGKPGKGSQIAQVAREILMESGGPMHTRTLVEEISKRGVFVAGGSNPLNYVSGLLSRSPDFDNDRHAGWRLAVWNKAMDPGYLANSPPNEPDDEEAAAPAVPED